MRDFRSIRQFNDTFKHVFNMSPSSFRNVSLDEKKQSDRITLALKYTPPFHYDAIFAFLKNRLIKGVEIIENGIYSRTFRINDSSGYFSVTNRPELSALILDIFCDDVRCCMPLYHKVRKMFDLDTDISAISKHFKNDELLRKGMIDEYVPPLPVAFDSFEFTIRAILGQQISVKSAATLASRIAELGGNKTKPYFPDGLAYYFPDCNEMLALNIDGLGITSTRQNTIKNVLSHIQNGKLSLSLSQSYDSFCESFSHIKGVGDWTVQYVSMRGLGMVDSFPAKDLGIIKALTKDNPTLKNKDIERMSDKWRPFRAYAALCLWNSLI